MCVVGVLVCVQVQALNWPGSAFDISKEGNWLATGDSEGNVRVSDATTNCVGNVTGSKTCSSSQATG